MVERDYESIAASLDDGGTIEDRMRRVADVLWDRLSPTGVSWVGFYLPDGADQLILGPSRNKPACSPIGLHGACGQVFLSGQPLVVHDVRNLGESYVACDPRDQSEVVLPLFGEDNQPWAVLDLDSFDIGAFAEHDVAGLRRVLCAAGLTRDN